MILDRGMNIGDVESDRQPAREGVKIAHVDFALARDFQLPLQPGGELADHHRDEDEQQQVDDFLRVADAEVIERREKEEGRGEHAANGGEQRRDNAPAGGRDHDRDQINDGAAGAAG